MTPAEVLAMRDRLAEEMWDAKLGVCYDDCVSVADWLLTSRLTREKIAEVLGEDRYYDPDQISYLDRADAILALFVDDIQS